MLAPWRKSFPICKPYEGGTSEDAARFLKDFIDGLDDIAAGYLLGSRFGWSGVRTRDAVCVRGHVEMVSDFHLARVCMHTVTSGSDRS